MGRQTERQVQEKKIVLRLPYYGRFDYARLGSFSLTTKDCKYISKEDVLTIDDEVETPGYFFGKFMKGLWCAKKKENIIQLSYPYRAIPGKIPMALYVDIRQAFKQIACAYGMEVFVQEGRFIAFGETIPDAECFNNKICRGLLVTGTADKGSFTEWKNHDLSTVHFSNPNYAPHVRYAIWATLHAIQSVLSPFVQYAHTDGVICYARHAEKVFRTLDKFGFSYTIKETGYAEVYGIGNYRIGKQRTRTTGKSRIIRDNIRTDNAYWWLEKFATGIDLRKELKYDDLYEGIEPDSEKGISNND